MSYKVIIFITLFFYYSVPASTLDCGCMHDAQCLQLKQQVNYCKCSSNYTGRFCNIETKELNQKSLSIDVNEQYSYYHISFNNTILYLLQMYFCPINYQQTNIFEIYIEFQERDGSIDNSTVNKKIMKFEAENSQCLAFRTLLSTPQQKYDKTSPRLVVRLRRTPLIRQEGTFTPTELADKQKVSKVSIIIYKFQIYQMESLQIGQFVAITLFSALLILLFSFFLCKRTLLRRYRRYHYHPAQRVHDITHFDTIMPSIFRNQEFNSENATQQIADLQEEAKECMICLLEVSGTLTRTTPCKHLFHQDCIDEWGRKSLTCPACRNSLASGFQNISEN